MAKKKRKPATVKTGFTPTTGTSGLRYGNRKRVVGLTAFMVEELDPYLLEQIPAWEEGFKVGGINAGGVTPDPVNSRTLNEAIRGMVDHDKEGKQTVIPIREGHGLDAAAKALHIRIRAVEREVAAIVREGKRFMPMDAGVADLKIRHENLGDAGAGYCEVEACLHLCTGHLNDARKSGFCPACYRAWRRNETSTTPQSRIHFVKTRVPRRDDEDDVTVTNAEGEPAGHPPQPTEMSLPSPSTGAPASGETQEERSA